MLYKKQEARVRMKERKGERRGRGRESEEGNKRREGGGWENPQRGVSFGLDLDLFLV